MELHWLLSEFQNVLQFGSLKSHNLLYQHVSALIPFSTNYILMAQSAYLEKTGMELLDFLYNRLEAKAPTTAVLYYK